MQKLKWAAVIGCLVFMTSCSNGLDENSRPLAASTESAFHAYDLDQNGFVTAKEILRRETDAGSTVITTQARAQEAVDNNDMDGDSQLDSVEFTGLLNEQILIGLPKRS